MSETIRLRVSLPAVVVLLPPTPFLVLYCLPLVLDLWSGFQLGYYFTLYTLFYLEKFSDMAVCNGAIHWIKDNFNILVKLQRVKPNSHFGKPLVLDAWMEALRVANVCVLSSRPVKGAFTSSCPARFVSRVLTSFRKPDGGTVAVSP